VTAKLEKLAFEHNVLATNGENPIWGSVTPKFQNANSQINTTQPAVSVELQPIRQSLTAELEEENYPLSAHQLLSRLSFTHFVELISVEDNLQRLFYEVEAIKNNWSVRELARAIDTSLALRTTLSTNKEAIIKKIKNLKPTSTAEVMRNPVVLEFLDLEEKSEYSETDLETANLTTPMPDK